MERGKKTVISGKDRHERKQGTVKKVSQSGGPTSPFHSHPY